MSRLSLPILTPEPEPPLSPLEGLLAQVRGRIQPPVAVVLGSPRQAAALVTALGRDDTACYQMDLYQAGRLRQELGSAARTRIVVAPDLWDVPAEFRTALFVPQQGGERALKIDMVEQAWHILQPGGGLIVLSSYESDQLFYDQMKKVYGKAHQQGVNEGTVIWAKKLPSRERERPERARRRHEITIQARLANESLRLLTRPGVFSYGELDAGARALIESMTVRPGGRVLDLGCGIGSNGVVAGRHGAGEVWFVDSNLRAVTLAEHNATACGLTGFRALGSDGLADLPTKYFDLVLANPPYFAQQAIAHFFIERAQILMKRSGQLLLVTRQAAALLPMLKETFGEPEIIEKRGYTIFRCQAR